MKRLTKYIVLIAAMGLFSAGNAFAQFTNELQYYRYQDQRGLNVFEAPFKTDVPFDGLEFKIGGANTLQFQGLNHSNNGSVALINIGPNFNLATSNLDIDAALGNGLRMHLRTYLTSRHHTEPYVKDGYFQVDRLDFIKEGFLSDVMDHLRLKVGHMEINYGDNHFRRSDNGQAIFNPFVGNYIMDSFTTEVGGEAYYNNNGFLAMFGVTNGKLNQSVVDSDPATKPSIVGKLGYDSQVNPDLRVRLTGSIYSTKQSSRVYLYSGDRAGSRYYFVMEEVGSNSGDHVPFTSGRFDPGFRNELTSFMVNPFIKYQGVEFYGVFENATGKALGENNTRTFNQYGAELLYRFGSKEQLYVGGRYNLVSGEEATSGNNIDITRINFGGGWFLTQNILAKAEYVNQQYDGFASTSIYSKGKFDGVMFEAVISF